jgi:hypothetical protein
MATALTDKKSPIFDFSTGEFVTDASGKVLSTTGILASVPVLIKAMQTPRGRFSIYRNSVNTRLNHKYGNSAWHILTRPFLSDAVRLSEIKRAMADAIKYDPWVKEVYNVQVVRRTTKDPLDPKDKGYSDVLDFECTVRTIFDGELTIRGVVYNDQASI